MGLRAFGIDTGRAAYASHLPVEPPFLRARLATASIQMAVGREQAATGVCPAAVLLIKRRSLHGRWCHLDAASSPCSCGLNLPTAALVLGPRGRVEYFHF